MLSLSHSSVKLFIILFASLSLYSIIINQYHQSLAEENANVNNYSISNSDSISDNRFSNIISNSSKATTTRYGLSEPLPSPPSPTSTSLRSGIGVDTYPIGISVNPVLKKIYVANEFSNTVSVVDIPTLKAEKTINVENFPYAIDSNILNNRVYVTDRGSNTVSVIDGSTNSIC